MATPSGNDVDIVNGAEAMDKYLRWPREMDQLLLDCLKNEKAKGNKDEKQFTKEAWKVVVDALNLEFKKIDKKVNKAKTVNRLKTIQKLMALSVELLDKSGFGWNDVTKKLDAAPSVWEGVIKVKSDYKLVRDKELYFLEDACELFEKDRAHGGGAESAKEKMKRWQQEQQSPQQSQEINIDDIYNLQATNEVCLEQLNPFSTTYHHSPMEHSPIAQDSAIGHDNVSSTPSQSKAISKGKRKKPMSGNIANEIMEVTCSMREIANAIKTTSHRVYSATEIASELKKLGLDKWEVMDALDFLTDNDKSLVDRFFACDDEIKLSWLRRKMGISMDD